MLNLWLHALMALVALASEPVGECPAGTYQSRETEGDPIIMKCRTAVDTVIKTAFFSKNGDLLQLKECTPSQSANYEIYKKFYDSLGDTLKAEVPSPTDPELCFLKEAKSKELFVVVKHKPDLRMEIDESQGLFEATMSRRCIDAPKKGKRFKKKITLILSDRGPQIEKLSLLVEQKDCYPPNELLQYAACVESKSTAIEASSRMHSKVSNQIVDSLVINGQKVLERSHSIRTKPPLKKFSECQSYIDRSLKGVTR